MSFILFDEFPHHKFLQRKRGNRILLGRIKGYLCHLQFDSYVGHFELVPQFEIPWVANVHEVAFQRLILCCSFKL